MSTHKTILGLIFTKHLFERALQKITQKTADLTRIFHRQLLPNGHHPGLISPYPDLDIELSNKLLMPQMVGCELELNYYFVAKLILFQNQFLAVAALQNLREDQ